MKSKLYKFLIILILFILFLFITIKSYASSVFNDLSDNIFRLHIIANSDSDEDQDLKLKIRDEIIEYMEELTQDCTTKDDVITTVQNNINEFYNIANETITKYGYNYSVNIEIGNFYFPTKYYANISLPSGFYDALKIEIGEAARSKLVV